jgi:hypothetical protein
MKKKLLMALIALSVVFNIGTDMKPTSDTYEPNNFVADDEIWPLSQKEV